MTFLRKLERKYGKYAISNLTLYLIICYAIGYILSIMSMGLETSLLDYFTLNPHLIFKGQIWRLVTWILVPPQGLGIFTLIMLYFYYSIGRSLEQAWGTFLYNVYMFSGIIFTVIGALLMYGVFQLFIPGVAESFGSAEYFYWYASLCFSTYYVCMSIFLAYAITFPEARILLMMVIPIKVKVLGIIYAVIIAYDIMMAAMTGIVGIPRVVGMLCPVLNAVIFFIVTRKGFRTPKQIKRQREFKNKTSAKIIGITRHKCAICGRTEVDSPELEFRFCSKCNGNYEYCSEHLYTHKHVE